MTDFAEPERRVILCDCGHETEADGQWRDYFTGDGDEDTGWSADDDDLRCENCGEAIDGISEDTRRVGEAPHMVAGETTYRTSGGMLKYRRAR